MELFRLRAPEVASIVRVSNMVTQLRSKPGMTVGLNCGMDMVALGKFVGAKETTFLMVVAGIPPAHVHCADVLCGIKAAMKTNATIVLK